MRVLVTGGAGFIGSHTVALLRASGHDVRVLDNLSAGRRENLEGLGAELVVGDIADADTVARCMDGVERVIHLAALPSVPGSCGDPVGYDTVNVHGFVVVAEAARRAGVERMAYASTSAVYGSDPSVPKREDMSLPLESPYAAAKAANELYGRVYTNTLGLECVGLRYFNVFGPRQDPNGAYAAVIPRFVERALRGDPLTVFGDGEQGRDFVSVSDVARANFLAATAPGVGGRVFNVGTGALTTVNQLGRYVLDVVGGTSEMSYHPPRPGDVKVSVADVSAIAEGLGWRAEADFDAAMRETVGWYRRLVQDGVWAR